MSDTENDSMPKLLDKLLGPAREPLPVVADLAYQVGLTAAAAVMEQMSGGVADRDEIRKQIILGFRLGVETWSTL